MEVVVLHDASKAFMVSLVGMRWWRNIVRMAGWAVELISSDQCSIKLSYSSALFSALLFLNRLSTQWALICWSSGTTEDGQSSQKANSMKLSLMLRWDVAVGWRICHLTLDFRQLQGAEEGNLWITFLNLEYVYVVYWFVGGVLSDPRFFHSCLPVPSSPVEDTASSWQVTAWTQLFVSLLFLGQHQHDVHGPEAFSVWWVCLGLVLLLSNKVLQVLGAVCLLWDLGQHFRPQFLYSRYWLTWVPAVGCRVWMIVA